MSPDLAARIGLGCGRFRGGFEEANSRRILEAAVRGGIRYFDTAPSYGGGDSERIVGRGLSGMRDQVELCTKIGLRPAAPRATERLRGLVLSTMQTLLPESVLTRIKSMRRVKRKLSTQRGYGTFECEPLGSSVQRSLQSLQTDYLDCLMLHEPRLTDPTEEFDEALRKLVAKGLVKLVGVGTYAYWQDLPAYGDVAQYAVGRLPKLESETRICIGHGVLRGFMPDTFAGCFRSSGILDGAPSLQRFLDEPVGLSALLCCSVISAGEFQRVLVSTHSIKRLEGFMSAADAVYGEMESRRSPLLDRQLRDCVRTYVEMKLKRGDSDG